MQNHEFVKNHLFIEQNVLVSSPDIMYAVKKAHNCFFQVLKKNND